MKHITYYSIALIVSLIVIDFISKIYIKTNFNIEESVSYIGDWAQLYFVENPGFAFGAKFWGGSADGERYGKIFLTLFRSIASVVLLVYLSKLWKKEGNIGVIIGLSLIVAGAIGNLVDCIFYGVVFSPSTIHTVSVWFPEVLDHSQWFVGKVVDMFYFPVIRTTYPEWIPFVGGSELVFFRFVFNVADAAITCGVFYLILFQRAFFIQSRTQE